MMSKKKQLAPSLLLVFVITWQTDSLVHLLFTPHTICEHGKIVDVDPESGRPLHHEEDKDNPDHEDCRVLAFLTSAETLVSRDVLCGPVGNAPVDEAELFQAGNTALPKGESLFRLSPSNSPPLSS